MHGDRVLAEPAARRLAEALGTRFGCEPRLVRRPDELADVVADLRTFPLFAEGKIVIVVESGLFADRAAAGTLFDDVRAQLPWSGTAEELQGKARDAALRLLQILRLFDLDAATLGAERALAGLPAAVFAGKSGRAGKAKDADETRAALQPLLAAAVAAGLRGLGEGDASLVADLMRDGLPECHALILVESALADGHPLLEPLARRDALVAAGEVTAEKGKFGGLGSLAAELEGETGVAIDRPALEALARRTLKGEDRRRGGQEGAIEADSTARFAGEYRKLAALAGAGGRIGLAHVNENVEDRGEEDVWGILDAISAGKGAAALAKLTRRIAGAEDPVLERLSFFGLLAALCRRIVAVRGAAALTGLPLTERNYGNFDKRYFQKLVGPLPGIESNPLKGSRSAYPLFKAYQAAARLPLSAIERLPDLVLETERRLKGDSGEPDAALANLVLALANPG